MLMRHAVEMAEVNDVQLMCLNVQVRRAVVLNPRYVWLAPPFPLPSLPIFPRLGQQRERDSLLREARLQDHVSPPRLLRRGDRVARRLPHGESHPRTGGRGSMRWVMMAAGCDLLMAFGGNKRLRLHRIPALCDVTRLPNLLCLD